MQHDDREGLVNLRRLLEKKLKLLSKKTVDVRETSGWMEDLKNSLKKNFILNPESCKSLLDKFKFNFFPYFSYLSLLLSYWFSEFICRIPFSRL